MAATEVRPNRSSALVLDLSGAPQIVALARDTTDVQLLSIEPEEAEASWIDQLQPPPAMVVADVRSVRALLAEESGRSWLAALSELSLALPVGEDPALLLPTATALEPLGLQATHVEYVTSTIAVFLSRSAGGVVAAPQLGGLVVEALVRAAAEATSAADTADRTRRNEALAVAKLQLNIDRETARADRAAARAAAASVTRRKKGRWARAVRDPKTAASRVLGRVKRRLT